MVTSVATILSWRTAGLAWGRWGVPGLSGEAGSMSKPWSGRPSSSWTLSKSLATHALESPSRPSKCKSSCRSRPNTSVISLRPVWSCKRVGSSNIEMSSGVAVSLEGSSWTMWLCVTMCHCVCFFPNSFFGKGEKLQMWDSKTWHSVFGWSVQYISKNERAIKINRQCFHFPILFNTGQSPYQLCASPKLNPRLQNR